MAFNQFSPHLVDETAEASKTKKTRKKKKKEEKLTLKDIDRKVMLERDGCVVKR